MLKNEACPCNYTTPCKPDCTCINPVSSAGCHRCCSYGSIEQRRKNAERITKAINLKDGMDEAFGNRETENG